MAEMDDAQRRGHGQEETRSALSKAYLQWLNFFIPLVSVTNSSSDILFRKKSSKTYVFTSNPRTLPAFPL